MSNTLTSFISSIGGRKYTFLALQLPGNQMNLLSSFSNFLCSQSLLRRVDNNNRCRGISGPDMKSHMLHIYDWSWSYPKESSLQVRPAVHQTHETQIKLSNQVVLIYYKSRLCY